jgi:MATE family multidrug resistance protein
MAKWPVEEALLAAGEPEAEEEILSVREELKKQLWLAGPMIAGALLQNVIQMISVMYVGHLGELPLAGASMANSFATVTGLSLLVTTYLLLPPITPRPDDLFSLCILLLDHLKKFAICIRRSNHSWCPWSLGHSQEQLVLLSRLTSSYFLKCRCLGYSSGVSQLLYYVSTIHPCRNCNNLLSDGEEDQRVTNIKSSSCHQNHVFLTLRRRLLI